MALKKEKPIDNDELILRNSQPIVQPLAPCFFAGCCAVKGAVPHALFMVSIFYNIRLDLSRGSSKFFKENMNQNLLYGFLNNQFIYKCSRPKLPQLASAALRLQGFAVSILVYAFFTKCAYVKCYSKFCTCCLCELFAFQLEGLFVGWCYVVLRYACKTCGCIFGLRLFVLSCVYKCFCKVIFSARNVLCELFAFWLEGADYWLRLFETV